MYKWKMCRYWENNSEQLCGFYVEISDGYVEQMVVVGTVGREMTKGEHLAGGPFCGNCKNRPARCTRIGPSALPRFKFGAALRAWKSP